METEKVGGWAAVGTEGVWGWAAAGMEGAKAWAAGGRVGGVERAKGWVVARAGVGRAGVELWQECGSGRTPPDCKCAGPKLAQGC